MDVVLRLLDPGVLPRPLIRGRPNNAAFARRLFDALLDNLREMTSRVVGAGKWNGVLGGGSSESSPSEMILGVALSVPHVMSCPTATGQRDDEVGEGRLGTSV
jgi:hypothetical protein